MTEPTQNEKDEADKAFGPCPVNDCRNTRAKYRIDCGQHGPSVHDAPSSASAVDRP